MEDTSYYFFSTVPQVIATVIALIGVFHLFRNQNEYESLIRHSQETSNLLIEKIQILSGEKGSKDTEIIMLNLGVERLNDSLNSKDLSKLANDFKSINYDISKLTRENQAISDFDLISASVRDFNIKYSIFRDGQKGLKGSFYLQSQ